MSAVVFASAHAASGITLAYLSMALAFGVMLAAAYAASGRLWLPIGLHAGWDFADGSMFGSPGASGPAGHYLIVGKLNAENIWSLGPLAPAIVAIMICLAVAAYFLWRIVKLRRTEPPIWSDRTARSLDERSDIQV